MTTDLPVFPLDHLPLFGEADAPALIIRDTRYSYKELNLRIGRLASLLKEKGYAPGDRVATWLGKGEIACLMPLASVRAGLVHVPVNPVLKAPQVKHILTVSLGGFHVRSIDTNDTLQFFIVIMTLILSDIHDR